MSRPIDAEELLRAMDSHDKFGIDPHGYIRRISGDKYGDLVPYVHYKDMTEAVENMPTVEAIPKADYEQRLKADLEAILVELQLEIEEKEQYYQEEFLESKNAIHDAAMSGRMFGCGECKEVIQQKINVLKSESEG